MQSYIWATSAKLPFPLIRLDSMQCKQDPRLAHCESGENWSEIYGRTFSNGKADMN